MIALVEGAERQKTPNEIALNILLAGLTIIFLLAVVTLQPFAIYSNATQTLFVLISLLVCLIPTTIGGLLSAIGIAGMDRLIQHNVLAMSGRAVEAAGDVNTLLLDKTGTITLGNRQAAEFIPLKGVSNESLADAAQLSSLADETPEGRSIVVLAKEKYGLRGREIAELSAGGATEFIPFTAQTRMSGLNLDAPYDARRADDVLDCQRRGEILRHYSGDVFAHFPAASSLECDEFEIARIGDFIGGNFQRARDYLFDSARLARCKISPVERSNIVAKKFTDLRFRRANCAVHRNQNY